MSTQKQTNNDTELVETKHFSPTLNTDELPRLQVSVADSELQDRLYDLSRQIRNVTQVVMKTESDLSGDAQDSMQASELTTDNVHVAVAHIERREKTVGDIDILRGSIDRDAPGESFYFYMETTYNQDANLGDYRETKAVMSRTVIDMAELTLEDIGADGFYLLAEDKVDRTDVYVLPGGDVEMTISAISEAIRTIEHAA